MWNTCYLAILHWNTKEKVIFFKIFSNFGPAQPGPSILNLAQAWPGPKANIDLGPWPGRAIISKAHFRPGPKNFGPNSSLVRTLIAQLKNQNLLSNDWVCNAELKYSLPLWPNWLEDYIICDLSPVSQTLQPHNLKGSQNPCAHSSKMGKNGLLKIQFFLITFHCQI